MLNLTAALEAVIGDITLKMEDFRHIDPSRVLVCVSSTRGSGIHGVYAKIHPLRFPGGERTTTVRRGLRTRTVAMPTITHRGVEMLYVIYFLVPRFMDLPFREKLITIFHEMFHISPSFDGDIRRFPGRNFAHGSSTKGYNGHMAKLADKYLDGLAEEHLLQFLHDDMEKTRSRHATIIGRKMPAPKLEVVREI